MAMFNPNLPPVQILDPNQRIAALEARVARLEAALHVSPVGAVTLKSTSSVTIQAGTQLELTCPGTVKILAGGLLQMKGARIQN